MDTASCKLIAEIGASHAGSLQRALMLTELAAQNGADVVKFQKRDIDLVYSKEILDTPRESPWGKTTREQKNGLEFNLDSYQQIDN